MRITAQTPAQTMEIAEKMARAFSGGEVIGLDGALGAGKTVFVKGLAKGLGIASPILSPTFNIVREYSGQLPLYHFDVYRIADPEEMFEIGFEEYLSAGGVTIIEWSTNIAEIMPENCLYIHITGAGDSPREITIFGADEKKWEAILL